MCIRDRRSVYSSVATLASALWPPLDSVPSSVAGADGGSLGAAEPAPGSGAGSAASGRGAAVGSGG
eukprot:3603355-Alexandrium_andersonii.AAC.1